VVYLLDAPGRLEEEEEGAGRQRRPVLGRHRGVDLPKRVAALVENERRREVLARGDEEIDTRLLRASVERGEEHCRLVGGEPRGADRQVLEPEHELWLSERRGRVARR